MKEKIRFQDLSGWVKFAIVVSWIQGFAFLLGLMVGIFFGA